MLKRMVLFCGILIIAGYAKGEDAGRNLLLNPDFEFHAFENHRSGKSVSFESNNTAFWNSSGSKEITVKRSSHVPASHKPDFYVHNFVYLAPGSKISQFFTLPEVDLLPGKVISLYAYMFQNRPGSIKAKITFLKIDSESGEWSPKDFGMADIRKFPKVSRGEMVVASESVCVSPVAGKTELRLENIKIPSLADGVAFKNIAGISVEFENCSTDAKDGWAWLAAPSLVNGDKSFFTRQTLREMNPLYRHIPRTIQKLWKGEPVHIVVMGSSIDRGSANPPMYVYDENAASPKFKQPLCDYSNFDTKLVGRPELNDYFGQSRHWFSYCGRLKVELMKKFNLPADKILLNFMACDGSCIGESHSGLREYCSLSLPPSPELNGHKSNKTWLELYPDLFKRPEGPRPDLVIYGSGANEKTDTPNEIAVFEGAIRWIQRNYPDTEFIFCPFQNYGGYTSNAGDMQALALRYQIPYLDFGKVSDDLAGICDPQAIVPADGHPQAAAHYIWFKQLEKAFECWDPVVTGIVQLQLPERLHQNTYGWEGEMLSYTAENPRINRNRFILDDTAVNLWGTVNPDSKKSKVIIDGREIPCRAGQFKGKDLRNSLFRHGDLKLGDRHVLELPEKDSKITAIDAKICSNRVFYPVSNPLWLLDGLAVQPFKSFYGAPYGTVRIIIPPGKSIEIETAATDLSIAYADTDNGGKLNAYVDGRLALSVPTGVKYTFIDGESQYLENRKGITGLSFGLHLVKIEAAEKPVTVLGLFSYDSRPNSSCSRSFAGLAAAGQTINFSIPFKARPVIFCNGGIQVKNSDITPSAVTFSGTGTGSFTAIGE
ncbi:MAG: hypothetical protein WCV67_05510 [Victivallaceae bacterium]